jgi:hypothetical protein
MKMQIEIAAAYDRSAQGTLQLLLYCSQALREAMNGLPSAKAVTLRGKNKVHPLWTKSQPANTICKDPYENAHICLP